VSLRTFGAVREPQLTQPVSHVRQGLPPMFLASGEQDRVVLPRNATRLAERLEAAGVAARVRLYEKLGHAGPLLALTRPARFIAPVLSDLSGFLRAYLPLG